MGEWVNGWAERVYFVLVADEYTYLFGRIRNVKTAGLSRSGATSKMGGRSTTSILYYGLRPYRMLI